MYSTEFVVISLMILVMSGSVKSTSDENYVKIKFFNPCVEIEKMNQDPVNYDYGWVYHESPSCFQEWQSVFMNQLKKPKNCSVSIERMKRDILEKTFDFALTAVINLISTYTTSE